ncbi:hypothetical protein [Methylobacterium durans]|uniref:hypothetical protein n=1 Tax=Methylobacterium durans TaxID=2202825 RepID=UPI0013A56C27|nr:hypothetical protein [Methylobacterium durans]
MRVPFYLLTLLALAKPAWAEPQAVHLQPHAPTSVQRTGEPSNIRGEIADVYARASTRQLDFDRRTDNQSRKALTSVCSDCKERKTRNQTKSSLPNNTRNEVDADAIYSGEGFDPAQARID